MEYFHRAPMTLNEGMGKLEELISADNGFGRKLQLLERRLMKMDGCVKSPSAALRFTFVVAAYHPSTPHSSCFARLASGAFYAAIALATFYEIIKVEKNKYLITVA